MEEVGRPTVMTDLVLQKLREGFAIGLTDIECSLFAGIAVSTLYNYCRENPDFLEEKEILKNQPKIKAKINVNKALNEQDKEMSKWYLERKARDEFSLKQEIDLGNKDNKPLQIDFSNLTTEQIRELLKDEDKE